MKTIWKGWLTFGLINIPVNLYSGTKAKELSFHLLHEKDHSPIRFARICTKDGHEIPWEEVIKGYELENGDTVVLTEEDFEKANIKRVKSIEILDFADESEIDTVYYQKPYLLEPQKGASKADLLLREALKRSKKVGICKFVLRNREHLGVIKASKDLIVLNQLRFANELAHPPLEIPKGEKISKQEIEMAIKLIEQLTTHFNPKDYKDEYTQELLSLIKQKAKGKKVRKKGSEPKKTKKIDFMKTLKASLKRKAA